MLSVWLSDPGDTDWVGLEWIGVGAAAAGILVALRRQFLWWPLHPSGFLLAHASLAMTWVWFPMLMGWAMKALILRYGGMAFYRRGIPFFIGLLLGDVVVGVVWAILGAALNIDLYLFFPG